MEKSINQTGVRAKVAKVNDNMIEIGVHSYKTIKWLSYSQMERLFLMFSLARKTRTTR